MLEFEVRHWITNHEAGIGENRKPEAADQPLPILGPLAGRHNTIGNIFYGSNGYLAISNDVGYKTWMGKNQEPGPFVEDAREPDPSLSRTENNHFAMICFAYFETCRAFTASPELAGITPS